MKRTKPKSQVLTTQADTLLLEAIKITKKIKKERPQDPNRQAQADKFLHK